MQTTRLAVDAKALGMRLDRFLAARLAISRARVRHLLETGRVSRSGRAVAAAEKSHSVRLAEQYTIEGPLAARDERPLPSPELSIEPVAEGEGWLVVDKPPGRAVHPLRPDETGTVLNALVARRPELIGVGEGGLRSGVVHRLDVDTTGALVFASQEPVWQRLRGAFADHRVEKRYLAWVLGRLERAGRLDVSLAITRHSPARVEVVAEGGRACRQRLTPLRVLDSATLVEVDLETGFLHQIRASLAHLGHPLLGDVAYGGPRRLGSAELPRPLLHAARLAVDEIEVEIEPPPDFAAVEAAL